MFVGRQSAAQCEVLILDHLPDRTNLADQTDKCDARHAVHPGCCSEMLVIIWTGRDRNTVGTRGECFFVALKL